MTSDAGVAAAATLIAALVGVWVGARLERRTERVAQQLERCSQLLKAYTAAYGHLYRRCRDTSYDPEGFDWREWDLALSDVSLTCSDEIVRAARTVDQQIWSVSIELDGGAYGTDSWRSFAGRLDKSRLALINSARSSLGHGKELAGVRAHPTGSAPIEP